MSASKKEQKRLVILDTHAILHRAYHALPDLTSSKGEPTGALYGLVSMLLKIITDLKPDYVVATFDLPDPTHRHLAYEKYKAHRVETDEALVKQLIRSREVLEAFAVPCYEAPGFEADDVIGTIVEEMKGNKDIDLIIASGDMDMLQLVDDSRVRVFTFKKGLSETILYDEDAVVARFGFGPTLIPDYKGLRGDPSDNIPGVKGIGEKTAEILVQKFGTVEQLFAILKKDPTALASAGIKPGMIQKLDGQEEEASFSKMLALIRRDAPINFALPAQGWRDHVSSQKVYDMCAEFDFRSLLPRVRKLLEPKLFAESGLAEQDEGNQGPFREEATTEGSNEHIPQEDIERVGLAAWVLDSTITQPTLDDIYRVGGSRVFAEAEKNILAKIKEQDLLFVYEHIDLPLVPVLRQMERYGILVDREFLKQLSEEYHIELDKIAARIFSAAGGEFNINSPKQLGEILFDKLGLEVKNQKKTAGGQRSTKESELEKMRGTHPIIENILAYRELQKLLSTYIDTIPTLLDETSRLHTSFVQTGTTTGRVSSQDPNLQNIPIKSELGRAIRHAFVAQEGMQLLSFDYSQIELRVAAALSGDEALSDIFRRDEDIHTQVATRVFHVRPEEVTYEQRRRAKIINFGILYGMGVNSLRASLDTSREEAQDFYDQYFAAFPRLATYLDEVKQDAARLGYTKTLFGRRRYFEGIKSSIPFVRASAERMAINAPIQGTQADVVKLAMVEIDQWIQKETLQDDVHLLLQVHDELVFEVSKNKVVEYAPRIKQIMENVLSPEKRNNIPFKTEGKVGSNWGDMKSL